MSAHTCVPTQRRFSWLFQTICYLRNYSIALLGKKCTAVVTVNLVKDALIHTYMTCQKEGKGVKGEGKEVQSSKPVFLVVWWSDGQ